MKLDVEETVFALADAFTISRGSRTQARTVTVTLHDETGARGQGECVPYMRYGETVESVMATIESLRDRLAAGMTREELQTALQAGAARNALDCALWDLEAKRAGTSVWALAGLSSPPEPVVSAYTLSLDAPSAMHDKAVRHAHRPLLKLKLGGEGDEDIARLRAVRAGAPNARIIIDANEGWRVEDYRLLAPVMVALGVEMVEQPLPVDQDAALETLTRDLPVCADESCHDRSTLERLRGRYDMINIKLDKTGGLTEALALKQAAEALGFRVMVGCMVGSSLSMAPALLVAQGADVVDLDAPLLLSEDRALPMQFDDAGIHPASPALWG
ncbi:N-acetyl-D-Glu racemase DgcA [Larsenimonas salina]|uniref:N-acetyl-D-Glu racemase DgcA n=1 Tax=Larsenimonas salina TaxID=1295565 RepID=UPI0020737EB4|nr:N-acetyl-D-Glu racemase DgcA [Larsenimonas salina]MCM5704276.1 dipeptide epimerase [Larsenimonas salina]